MRTRRKKKRERRKNREPTVPLPSLAPCPSKIITVIKPKQRKQVSVGVREKELGG